MQNDNESRADYLKLKAELLRLRQLYENGSPELEDYQYDEMKLRLKTIETEHPDWIEPDSPTQTVGGEESDAPMLSIQDVFSTADVGSFVDKLKKQYPNAEFLVEEKVDGVSAAMRYRNGKLELILSRGTGKVGKDWTANTRAMLGDLRETIDGAPPYLELRGEIFITRSNFERINAEQLEQGREPFANPRNYVAGLMNSKNYIGERRLSFVVHGLMKSEGMPSFERHSEFYRFLESNGVSVIHNYRLCRTSEEVIRTIEEIGESRPNLDWEIDGVVIKIDNFNQREELGMTSNAPRWSIAYKFPPEIKQSIIRKIELNVGRTGRITPVAIFDPITLAGTTVGRATLHNKGYIKKLDVRIGSTVKVFKSGDIIPKIEAVVKNPEDSTPYVFIEECPSCGAKLDMNEWCCVNPNCPAQIENRIVYFAAKDAMDIEGLGKESVRTLVASGLIKNIADIYKLSRAELIEVCGFGPKETDNLLTAIERSKANSADKILTGLGISGVGPSMAELLIEEAGSIEKICNASVEELNDWLSKSDKEGARNIRIVFDELEKGTDADLFSVLTQITFVKTKTANRILEVFKSIDDIKNISSTSFYQRVTNEKSLKNFNDRCALNLIDTSDVDDLPDGIFNANIRKRLLNDSSVPNEPRKRSFDEIRNASFDQLLEWSMPPSLKNVWQFFDLLKRNNDDELADLLSKINRIDRKAAEKLAGHFGSLEAIKKAPLEELYKWLRSDVARYIREFFDLDENRLLLERLREYGLNVGEEPVVQQTARKSKAKPKLASASSGKTIVFTGALSITREEAAERAALHGFVIRNSITSKTTYLVVGDKPGSKLRKAEQLGVTILTEDQFNAMLDGK